MQPDDSTSAVVLFRDPSTQLKVTPTLFAQLPERDFMDHETGQLIPSHRLHGRVVWHGHVWLVFTDDNDPIPALYRYEMLEQVRPAAILQSERELGRLLTVIEALRAYHMDVDSLPVKLRVNGRSFSTTLYTHPCMAVRYPMMGLDERGEPGSSRQAEIADWVSSQGFDITDIYVPKLIGIMQSVMEHEDILLRQWNKTREELSNTGQIFLSPEADEVMLTDILGRLRAKKVGE